MPVTRRLAVLVLLGLGLWPARVGAQFLVGGGEMTEEEEEEDLTTTKYSGRISASGVYYGESGSAGVAGDEVSSPVNLMFADLRAKIQADHIDGSRWDGLGDLRIRVSSRADVDPVLPGNGETPGAGSIYESRGFVGGPEVDLKEAFVQRKGDKLDVALGRHIIREAYATTVDGAHFRYRLEKWDVGLFGGLYPNQFSRDFGTDYPQGAVFDEYPAAAGAYGAYRYGRAHGSIGAIYVLPRDEELVEGDPNYDPNRAILTAQGYAQLSDKLDLFHFAAGDATGPEGATLLNAQLGANYRYSPATTFSVLASTMSTHALRIYLRDLLEEPATNPANDPAGLPAQNNLALVRMAALEGRLGVNHHVIDKSLYVFGEVRYRKREALAEDGGIPMDIAAAIKPDTQIEASVGVRQSRSFGGWDLGATLVVIRGDRTSSNFITAVGRKTFLDQKLELNLDASYIDYADNCEVNMGVAADPTCTGTADGRTIRAGGAFFYRRDQEWVFMGQYHYATNSASHQTTLGTVNDPAINSHQIFLRAQYTFK